MLRIFAFYLFFFQNAFAFFDYPNVKAPVGSSSSYLGQANTAVVNDATAILYNPAGLSQIEYNNHYSVSSTIFSQNQIDSGKKHYNTTPGIVSIVQKANEVTFGIGVFNNYNFISESNKNEPNLLIHRNDVSREYYIFAAAYQNFGLSLDIIKRDAKLFFEEQIQNTVDGALNVFNSIANYNFKTVEMRISFGYQHQFSNGLKFGLKASTKTLFSDDLGSTIRINSTSFQNTNTGNSSFSSYQVNEKVEVQNLLTGGVIDFGVSYFYNKSSYHLKFSINEKLQILKIKSTDSSLLSQSDNMNNLPTTTILKSSDVLQFDFDQRHSAYDLSFGYEYTLNSSNYISTGISYFPSYFKSNKGMNFYSASIAYTKTAKKFDSTIGINYLKGIDNGNNYNGSGDKKIKNSLESLNISIYGAYHF